MTKTVWTAVLLVTKAEWANSLGLAGNQSVNLTRPGKELLFAPMSDQARQDRSNEPARTGLSTGTHNMAYLFRSFPVPLAYTKTSNAAISGHNLLHLKEKTATECALECSVTTWCKTFDYYKNHNWCDLSDKTAGDVGGLKMDYAGNPYDHYARDYFNTDPYDCVQECRARASGSLELAWSVCCTFGCGVVGSHAGYNEVDHVATSDHIGFGALLRYGCLPNLGFERLPENRWW